MLVAYIHEDTLGSLENVKEVTSISKREDVATILEVYDYTKKSVGFEKIKGVVTDTDDGYFYVVINDKSNSFSLFDFINSVYSSNGVLVTCCNANLLFPRSLSKGIYDMEESEEIPEEAPTAFLEPSFVDTACSWEIFSKRLQKSYEVKKDGIILGRSFKSADFVIPDNSNIGRVHCNIYLNSSGGLMVHDCDSKNGTFVNSQRVHSDMDVLVNAGDLLVLADDSFVIRKKGN